MSINWKAGGYILAGIGLLVGWLADNQSEQETKEYIDAQIAEREGMIVATTVDHMTGEAIDNAVARRFLAVAEADLKENES